MNNDQIRKARQELRHLYKQLGKTGPFMRGSVVRIGTRNKQFYFSLNINKKTRLAYLGDAREPIARTLSDNYRKILALIDQITLINMELLKNDALK